MTTFVRDLVLWELVQGAVTPKYRCYVRVTEQRCRFPRVLRLAEEVNYDAASEDPSATRVGLSATHIESALISRADEHGLVLYIKTVLAHTQNQEQGATFNDRVLYSYAALLL